MPSATSSFFATLQRTQSADKNLKGASTKGMKDQQEKDALLPLRNIGSGMDSPESRELFIGEMNSSSSSTRSCAARPLRNVGSGMDSPESRELFIGEMNSTSSSTRSCGLFASETIERQQQPQQRYVPGRLYSLIPGRLSFTTHQDDDHTRREIEQNPHLFFFSTDLQERYQAFCADFGPVNLGVLVQFCDYVRDKEVDERLQRRQLVYYCTNDFESVSNT
eukprot:3598784-Rhodomonas_salina.1